MANPIPFNVPVRDARIAGELAIPGCMIASAEHAESRLLAGYEVLQGLHDSGVWNFCRGALGSKDKVLDIAVGTRQARRNRSAAFAICCC